MKIAVLWTRESGYFTAMMRAAASRGHDVHLFSHGTSRAAPFSAEATTFPGTISRNESPASILANLRRLEPDVLITAGWHVPAYRAAAQAFKGRAVRLLSMDNQWLGNVRQRVGQLAFATCWRDTYDSVIVPGARQRAFALRLGFTPDRIYEGTYCADTDLYAKAAADPQRDFLFAGRNSPEKNLSVLLSAYRGYRATEDHPWRLRLVGAEDFDVAGLPGIDVLGFRDPQELAQLMGAAGAFILPSNKEPWGVVLHEAAAAGRFLIASSACGASDAFLLNGINGLTFNAADVSALTRAMIYVSSLSESELRTRGLISQETAQRFRSESWTLAIEAACARNENHSVALIR